MLPGWVIVKVSGLSVKLDRIDLDLMSCYKFYATLNGIRVDGTKRYYIVTSKSNIALHRVILERKLGYSLKNVKGICDHINGDTLDNRRENLRLVSRSLNGRNYRHTKNKTSKFRGVTRHVYPSGRVKFVSQFRSKSGVLIKYFDCEIQAAKQYDAWLLEHVGFEPQIMNFPQAPKN